MRRRRRGGLPTRLPLLLRFLPSLLLLSAALRTLYFVSFHRLPSVSMNPSAVNTASRSVLRTLARRAGPARASASSITATSATTRTVAAFSSIASPVASVADMSSTMASSTVPRRAFSSTSTLSTAAAPTGDEILAHFGDRASSFQGTDIAGAMESLAKADAVCFDVDSTVIDEEGIDVLAASLGKGEEVAAWTLKAMEGDTKFEDALAARLSIIQPSRAQIEQCLIDTPLRTSPGVDKLIAALNARGTDVYFISGGFRIMIEPVAKAVMVSKSNIVANTILFDEDGNYAGFDPNEPTSADMGKPKAVGQIKAEHGYETVVMVGDGATDMQAKPPADSFIGYGGVAIRDAVRYGACWFVKDFDAMTEIVNNFGERKRNN